MIYGWKSKEMPPWGPTISQINVGLLVVMTLMFMAWNGCSSKEDSKPEIRTNTVVSFLGGAILHAESDERCREVIAALEDMLTLSPAELRQQRYSDYQGNPGVWTITTLLKRQFMPASAMYLDSLQFYEDYTTPEAQAVIKDLMESLKSELEADSLGQVVGPERN